MAEPNTVAEIDRQLRDYRVILHNVSKQSQVAIWEQIDSLLEHRRKIQRADRRRARMV